MKRRRQQRVEERRRAGIEVNLLAESEGGLVITKTRKGCAIPFLGAGLVLFLGGGLVLITVELVRAGLG